MSNSKGKKVRKGRVLQIDIANCFDFSSDEEELFVCDSKDTSFA